MFRSLICLAALASLCACGPTAPPASAGSSPPPRVAAASLDDKAIFVAFQALDTVATAADALLAAGVLKPRSPAAYRIADGLEGAKRWLNIASHAQRAGRATDYITAITQASAAIAGVRAALKGN